MVTRGVAKSSWTEILRLIFRKKSFGNVPNKALQFYFHIHVEHQDDGSIEHVLLIIYICCRDCANLACLFYFSVPGA